MKTNGIESIFVGAKAAYLSKGQNSTLLVIHHGTTASPLSLQCYCNKTTQSIRQNSTIVENQLKTEKNIEEKTLIDVVSVPK